MADSEKFASTFGAGTIKKNYNDGFSDSVQLPGKWLLISLKRSILSKEKISNEIVVLRGVKVMLDLHLSEMYDVETQAFKQAVLRDVDLFPIILCLK